MLNRLVAIIYILLNKGTVTAPELAERFEVSVRTIYRDVEQLSMAGIPVYTRRGKNGGISLMDHFVLDKMVISQEEQQRILAALASLRETGAREEEEILQKLGAFFRADIPDWVAIDFSDWSGRRKQLFEQLRQAILGRRVLTFDYYGQYGEMSRRTVEPVQLLFKEYTWYLRAYCRKRQAMRLFKVLRMKRVNVLDETFESSHEYYGETGCRHEMQKDSGNEQATGVQSTEIVFWIDRKEAYRIYDRFGEEEIMVLPDGNFQITIHCPLDDWTYGLILSFGPSARIISPEFVKERMTGKIQEMQKNYL